MVFRDSDITKVFMYQHLFFAEITNEENGGGGFDAGICGEKALS